ncbi:MAG TPA: cytochrome ubiquinol oxidase subunit I [Caulifigura sp.]|jgi:hypothetical protein|nr:cytochrome ubiquinol oxidase subunit I [Caulifigura sp.]
MNTFPYYPVNDLGPLMKGMVIGGLGIFHVFIAQLAIGGGMLMCYLQWLHSKGRCPNGRRFIDDYFRVLVLVSFVTGAVTGVGMWFTTIQISPRTIGVMIREFHWLWAIEWTFFSLEVVSGYLFYRYGRQLSDRLRLRLLLLYSTAAWFSLFWINGILSWQLTPGGWLENHGVWAGFFNPSFWPSLFFRTVCALAEAALSACVLINAVREFSRDEQSDLISVCARPLGAMVLMPFLGLWYFASIPADSRGWITGGSAAMTLFLTLSVSMSTFIGAYAVFAMLRQKLYVNGATATLLLGLAFLASAGGEFVREGVRKPFTIREYLYSNSLTPDDVAEMRRTGCTTNDPYPLRLSKPMPNKQLELGAHVFRIQCSICHTLDGANAVVDLTSTWSPDQKRLNIAQLQRTKPFMPPFAGTPEELEALVQLVTWVHAGRPAEWPESRDTEVLTQIQQWLDAAGTEPGTRSIRAQSPAH